ncbi:SDR family oxidoreductase [Alicyclobacillus tolerans]|uniref:SDR family NAD(P)-dependent oxidoreductase n=1 Tax=Alicyclobacillus tolerans TaxID=90970 RepID=UPI001F2B1D6C|nr:glucose 1-dehydrogenase [Alicyclobacillus tolerans]MCF8567959.1 SDR family oxidoreductase [Alicyclobacillus tolerans]
MANRLEGKVAIVTGAAMGIGAATAKLMATEGASVVIADINQELGEQTAHEISKTGSKVEFVRTDVGVSEDVENLVKKTVSNFSKLNIMFNNAGAAIGGSVVDMSDEDWNRVLNTNLSSVFRGCKYAIPEMMKAGGGSIVNTSSVQALTGFKSWAGYAATKGGIIALTQQVALEYAPHNIRVNAIAPGTINTPMNTKIFDTIDNPQELIDTWNKMHPLGRFGQPEEVANAVVFLASDESSFITGICVRIDGGLLVKAE